MSRTNMINLSLFIYSLNYFWIQYHSLLLVIFSVKIARSNEAAIISVLILINVSFPQPKLEGYLCLATHKIPLWCQVVLQPLILNTVDGQVFILQLKVLQLEKLHELITAKRFNFKRIKVNYNSHLTSLSGTFLMWIICRVFPGKVEIVMP